ncbi:MAG: cobalamin B12-binding domain-containing protein [Chloroflexi bacterium]|nr:cobalamin B12-binding domain-containing protein [Chloroflexota bacterium]
MIQQGEKVRVLLTKRVTDAHDRGVKYIAAVLRDAGLEVVYMRFYTPEEIVNAAVQEDVDVIGVSSYGGAHIYIAGELMKLLKEKGLKDVRVLFGGIIPEDEVSELKKMGVGLVVGPGEPVQGVVDYVKSGLVR